MKRDMRKTEHKAHLGTAAKRDTYEQQKSVVVTDSKAKLQIQEQQQKGKQA